MEHGETVEQKPAKVGLIKNYRDRKDYQSYIQKPDRYAAIKNLHLMLKKQNYCTVVIMKIFVSMLIYNMKMVKVFTINQNVGHFKFQVNIIQVNTVQTQRQKPGGTETETLANMDQRGASNVLALGKGNVLF